METNIAIAVMGTALIALILFVAWLYVEIKSQHRRADEIETRSMIYRLGYNITPQRYEVSEDLTLQFFAVEGVFDDDTLPNDVVWRKSYTEQDRYYVRLCAEEVAEKLNEKI